MNLLVKITLGLLFIAPALAQPRAPSNANEAQILLFKGELPKQPVPVTPPRQNFKSAPPVSNQPLIPLEKPEEEFKEYKRMEDTNTKPCSGSQDCTLTETPKDNPMKLPPVDLSDPKTAPDVGKMMDQLKSAAEAAERNDDTPR